MKLSQSDLEALASIAIQAAQEAGAFISQAARGEVTSQFKMGGSSLASQVVTEVDRQAQEILLRRLRPTLDSHHLGLLAEESPDDQSRFEEDHFWCIDPLDGTLPFTQQQPGYAVSVALVSRSGVPRIGVVYDPVAERLYHAVQGQGACIEGAPWESSRSDTGRLRLLCDPSFPAHPNASAALYVLEEVAREQGFGRLEVKTQNGAVMNALQVLERAPALYLKLPKPEAGGGSLWDFAATACLFAEFGAVASDIQGKPLELNSRDSTFMNRRGVLYASQPDLARTLAQHFLTGPFGS